MTEKELIEQNTAQNKDNTVEWRFGVAANITHSHLDENEVIRYGSKAFKPGAKVYINGKNWDKENSWINAIGQNKYGRYVEETVPINLLENVRTQRVFNPRVLYFMDYNISEGEEWWERTSADRKDAEQFVKYWHNNFSQQ